MTRNESSMKICDSETFKEGFVIFLTLIMWTAILMLSVLASPILIYALSTRLLSSHQRAPYTQISSCSDSPALHLCLSWEVCIHPSLIPVTCAVPSCLLYTNNVLALWLYADLIPPACFPGCMYLHTCTWDRYPSCTNSKTLIVLTTLYPLLSMHIPIPHLTMGHNVFSPPKALLTRLASLLAQMLLSPLRIKDFRRQMGTKLWTPWY